MLFQLELITELFKSRALATGSKMTTFLSNCKDINASQQVSTPEQQNRSFVTAFDTYSSNGISPLWLRSSQFKNSVARIRATLSVTDLH